MSAQADRLQARINAIPKAVRAAVEPALLKSAEEIAGVMRQVAPDDPATGEPDLKSSIEITSAGKHTPPYSQPGGSMVVAENSVAITAGNEDVRYPHLLEYGTSKMEAQPFFWPALSLLRKKTTARIKRAIAKAVREAKA